MMKLVSHTRLPSTPSSLCRLSPDSSAVNGPIGEWTYPLKGTIVLRRTSGLRVMRFWRSFFGVAPQRVSPVS